MPPPQPRPDPVDIRALFERTGIGLVEMDLATGRFLKVNPAYCTLTGYSADELLQMTVNDLNHPDDADGDARARERMRRGESRYEVDKRYVRKDGRVVWVHVVGDVVRDADGQVLLGFGAVSDITPRVRTEQVQRELSLRQAFLLTLDEALRPLRDEVEVQRTAARLLAEHLDADRAMYGDIEDDSVAVIRAPYVRRGPAPTGRVPLPAFDHELVASLKRGEAVVLEDVASDQRLDDATRARLLGLGVAAAMGVALVRDGQRVAGFGVHSSTPRAWSQWDVTLLRETAERTWSAVSRARTLGALATSEARYRLLFEHSATGVVITDGDGRIVDCNPAFTALVGRPAPALLGTALGLLVHPDDRDPHDTRTGQVWAGSDTACDWEHRLVREDGSVVWVRSVCHCEHDGASRTVRLARYVIDITARKRIEGALRESQEQRHDLVETMQLLLETAAQGILSIDEAGRIVSANRAVETMFGYGRDTLIGREVEQLVPDGVRGVHAAHRAAYWRSPAPRPMGRGRDLVARRADGSTFPVEVSLNFVVTNGGGRAVAFITDISDRKAAESTLAQTNAALQERARALEQQTRQLRRMASDLTLADQRAREALARTLHDHLQQLLFSTKLRIDRLERSLAGSAAVPPGTFGPVRAEIDEAIDAARSLAVDIYPPVLQRHGLPAALAWLATWMQEKHGLTVTLSADPAADVDDRDTRTLLFESVRELLFDVVKHAGVTDAAVEVSTRPDGTLHITVRDDGVGFDPTSVLAGNGRGSGLGLVRIREHVASLGGVFEIDSARGRGARFRLQVPRRRLDEAIPPLPDDGGPLATPREARPARPPVRVLLVDDHAAVRQGLVEILRETPGVAVVGEAADGHEAISQARTLRPDVIVMDVSMPGLDGVEATRRILAEHPWIRIYGFSTHERTDGLHAIEAAGAAGFFLKHAGADELVQRILAGPPG